MNTRVFLGYPAFAVALIGLVIGCGGGGGGGTSDPVEVADVGVEDAEVPEEGQDSVNRLGQLVSRLGEVLQINAVRLHLKEILPGNPKPGDGGTYLTDCPDVILLPLGDGAILLDYNANACAGGTRQGMVEVTRLSAGVFIVTFYDEDGGTAELEDFVLDGVDLDGSLLFTRDPGDDNMYSIQNCSAAGVVADGANLIGVTAPSWTGGTSESLIEILGELEVESGSPPAYISVTGSGTQMMSGQTNNFELGRLPSDPDGTYPAPLLFDFPDDPADDPVCRCPYSGSLYVQSEVVISSVNIELTDTRSFKYLLTTPITLEGDIQVTFLETPCGNVDLGFEPETDSIVIPIGDVCTQAPEIPRFDCAEAMRKKDLEDGEEDGNITIDLNEKLAELEAKLQDTFPDGACAPPAP